MIINLSHKFNRALLSLRIHFPSSVLVNRFSSTLFFLIFAPFGFSQTTLYSENMFNGAGGASGDAIATHEVNNRFNEDGLTYSGTGDMRTTNASAGYAGVSGTWNACINAVGETFIMAGVDLSTCSSNLTISYGHKKALTADNGSTIVCEYSTAGSGGPWTAITFPALPTGAGTAIWYSRTSTSVIPSTANAFRWRSTDANDNRVDDINISCITGCTPVSEPTTPTSAITATPTSTSCTINYTRGNGSNAIAVVSTDCVITAPTDFTVYTANSTFGSGSVTAAGDYVVFIGSASSFSISGLSPSTSYCVQIFEFNGTATCVDFMSTGASQSFTTTATSVSPYLTGVLINACDASCSEGHNEIIFGTTADFSVLANVANIDIRYGTTSPASNTYTDTYVGVPATTTALNGFCPGTFVDGLNVTMPPGSKFMVVRSTFCPSDYNWSNLCGSGPIYVLYSSDATWVAAGNFDNSGGALRYFRINATTTVPSTNTVDYNYIPDNNPSAGNGAFIKMDSDGGVPVSYLNNGCIVTLPVVWGKTSAVCSDDHLKINWTTQSERNNQFFVIETSTNGIDFSAIGKVKAIGNSSDETAYHFETENPYQFNYYRIKQVDFNGASSYSEIVVANCFQSGKIAIYPNPSTGLLTINGIDSDTEIMIHDELGRVILQQNSNSPITELDISNHKTGMYFLTLKSAFKTTTIKFNLMH